MTEQLVIPNYQRNFVWNDIEGREFFEDVNLATENTSIFLGMFIFNKNKEEKPKEIEIVDGQQRITTILILLIACRVFAKNKDFEQVFIENIQRSITLHPNKPKDENLCRLKTSGRIGDSLAIMARPDWKGEYVKEMGNKHGWNRIKKAYEFFYEKLNDDKYNDEELSELINKVLEIEYIEIIVKNDVEAILTFEKVNARGQHLAVYDLMKAFLFSKKLEGNKDLETIEDDWDEIKINSEHTDNRLKKILYFFYFSKNGYISPANLYRDLKNIAEEDPKKFVNELKSFSKFYSVLSEKSRNIYSDAEEYLFDEMNLRDTALNDEERLNRVVKTLSAIGLFKVASVYPLIYASLVSLSQTCEKAKDDSKKEVDEWISLLEFFENFIFVTTRITHITSKFGGRLEKLYGEYCRKFSNNDGDLIKIINSLKKDFIEIQKQVSLNEFVEQFSELNYKTINDKGVIYYVFDKLNNLNKDGKLIKPANATGLHKTEMYKRMENSIEHILPQKNETMQEKIENLHSVGNLLIIYRKLNSKLGDKAPEEKIKIIKKWLKDSDIQNKPHIEDFVEQYGDSIERDGWNDGLIKERTEDIAKIIYKLAFSEINK